MSLRILVVFNFFFITGCGLGGGISAPGLPSAPALKALSLQDSLFTTCNYVPQARIVHFPMQHYPPDGQIDSKLFDRVTRSQFQLMHTILNYYNHIAVFDEAVSSDHYSQEILNGPNDIYYTRTRFEEKRFYWSERQQTAKHLFPSIPLYYEHLTEPQKQYLLDTGGSLTLFFLGHLQKIYKVVHKRDHEIYYNQLLNLSRKYSGGISQLLNLPRGTDTQRDYWLFDYREKKLFDEVVNFYHTNPFFRGIVLIAYGSNHDFADEFTGYAFSSAEHCIQWLQSYF